MSDRSSLTPKDELNGGLVLSASEIASYVFCFVPMAAEPSRGAFGNDKEWCFLSAGRLRCWRGEETVNQHDPHQQVVGSQ